MHKLESLFARQRRIIIEVVQQVVELDASLLGLTQEGDEHGIMTSVQEWNAHIGERWRALRKISLDG